MILVKNKIEIRNVKDDDGDKINYKNCNSCCEYILIKEVRTLTIKVTMH